MQIHSPHIHVLPDPAAELDRLGGEIAELSAHLEAATARLLDLIREFDTRGGWNTGFRSCAAWLSWRVGLDLGEKRAIRSIETQTARSNSDGPMVGLCPRRRRRLRCPPIPCKSSGQGTSRKACVSMHVRPARDGLGNASMWVGRSMSYTRWPPGPLVWQPFKQLITTWDVRLHPYL
jgi:hypothetical protein